MAGSFIFYWLAAVLFRCWRLALEIGRQCSIGGGQRLFKASRRILFVENCFNQKDVRYFWRWTNCIRESLGSLVHMAFVQ